MNASCEDPVTVSAPEPSTVNPATLPLPRLRRHTMLHEIIETVLLVIAIYTLVNLLTERRIVEGASMQPNFETGEWLIVDRVSYFVGEPQRGDVVILDLPEQEEDLIKRVIGLPGETVEIHDGQVFVNGVQIDEPYIAASPRYRGSWTLGPTEYFVLGDNRNNSRDSHVFGPVDREEIIGRAWVIYWPPQDWGIVPRYAYDDVSAPAP